MAIVKPQHGDTGWDEAVDEVIDRVNELEDIEGDIAAVISQTQPLDSDLTSIAGLSSSASGMIASDGSGWIKKTYAQVKTALSLTKSDVGLGNVDNTSDSSKPISTLTQEALDEKSNTGHTHPASDIASGTFNIARVPTGTSGSTVALGNHTHSGTYADASHTHDYAASSHTHGSYATTTTTDALDARLDVLETPNVSLTDASTVAINAALGSRFKVTLGGSRTLGNPTNAYDGQVLLITVKQDGAGSRAVTLDTKYRLPAGVSLEWSDGAGDIDKLLVQYDSADDAFDVLAFQAGY